MLPCTIAISKLPIKSLASYSQYSQGTKSLVLSPTRGPLLSCPGRAGAGESRRGPRLPLTTDSSKLLLLINPFVALVVHRNIANQRCDSASWKRLLGPRSATRLLLIFFKCKKPKSSKKPCVVGNSSALKPSPFSSRFNLSFATEAVDRS